ncbi:sigma-70 family RNA polymerase sigma factor [Haliangium sp.]|uniref:sigma-70 family RNA polymerase sigma factor n=1 Tax=Haliangium sp. TaxID=2663208 RepID=UPI003D10BC0A
MDDAAASADTLVARVASAGDRRAFTALFHAYAPRLQGFFRRGGVDDEVAGELVQEVMLRLWRGAATYDAERGSVDTWLFRIARNVRADHAGARRRYEPVPDDPALIPAAPEAPDQAAERRRRAVELRAALDTLPRDQADTVRAVYFGSQSMQAVADAQSIPVGTVKSRIRLGFQRLRAALGRDVADSGGL